MYKNNIEQITKLSFCNLDKQNIELVINNIIENRNKHQKVSLEEILEWRDESRK